MIPTADDKVDVALELPPHARIFLASLAITEHGGDLNAAAEQILVEGMRLVLERRTRRPGPRSRRQREGRQFRSFTAWVNRRGKWQRRRVYRRFNGE